MSLIMQKTYRSRYESSINYTMVFVVLFAFAMIIVGIAGYTIPDFKLGTWQSISLVVFGSGVLFFSLSNIIMKATSGKTRMASMLASFLLVVFFLLLAFIGSGILEVGF